jgi:hypothetical protein
MAKQRALEPEGIFDRIARGVGDAITDIRQKLIDEGWFGRSVMAPDATPGQDTRPHSSFADLPRSSFAEDWSPRAPGERDAEHAHGLAHEPEIDR